MKRKQNGTDRARFWSISALIPDSAYHFLQLVILIDLLEHDLQILWTVREWQKRRVNLFGMPFVSSD
ncbi:hypothetical protein Pan216_47070 [Planctomycetes bacterium Pan216]|uniref:Uncharacterized protein n=1 Tax=Kolteria novifilia TaxID=2527975 RepID=A0A518BA11_9BACT|nr:hypothetical protein Pan216_47070 [Planctomycetes bacterium Pan216]